MLKYKDFNNDDGKVLIRRLFEGVDKLSELNKTDFHNKDWYEKYEWTEKQQRIFKDWYYEYLRIKHPTLGKKTIQKIVELDTMNYGWKIKC